MRDQKIQLMESLWFGIKLGLYRDVVPTDRTTIHHSAFFLFDITCVSQSNNWHCNSASAVVCGVNLINGVIQVENYYFRENF